MIHMESVRAIVTLWRLQTTLCYKPGNSPGWCNTEAPCLSPSSSATWLGRTHVGCPQRSRYDRLSPGLQLHLNHQGKRFPSNTDLPPVTRKGRKATANHPTRSFKTQQIPHQGGELVFSLTGPLIYLFKCYPGSKQGRIPSSCRSVMPSSSDLQQDSNISWFPPSLNTSKKPIQYLTANSKIFHTSKA